MPEYLSPGVYVEEFSTRPRPIEGVSTSTLGFVGQTERGPTSPRLITSFLDYSRLYGRLSADPSYLPLRHQGILRQWRPACLPHQSDGQRGGARHHRSGPDHFGHRARRVGQRAVRANRCWQAERIPAHNPVLRRALPPRCKAIHSTQRIAPTRGPMSQRFTTICRRIRRHRRTWSPWSTAPPI